MSVTPDPAEAVKLEEERQLVERAQSGDRSALRPLFERYAEPLYAAVLPRLGDAATAEDVVKDTFLTAIEKIDGFEWQGRGVYGWLRQIALNKVIDVHRRTQRAGRLLAAFADEAPLDAPVAVGADQALIAEEERRENAARITSVMAELSPRYRQAIQLRLVEELSREACAERLGITVGNFDVLLFRAVRAFRRLFGDRGTP
jgi:RNA polymerase sigma-70 factor (ECF subfamily)